MRQFIITFCFLVATFSLQAAPIEGIRIESNGGPVIVFVDGVQICTPIESCFIAHLKAGHYQIEVFSTNLSHSNDRGRKEELLYKEYFHYRGRGIQDITVKSRNNYPNKHKPYHDRTMDDYSFDDFFRIFKKHNFDSERTKMIGTALVTSDFTTEQCRRIIKVYSFDSEKIKVMQMIYPQIVDKQNFFKAVGLLTFPSDKNKMNEFIKKYHEKEK